MRPTLPLKISLITACLNRREFIGDCLDSVASQTYADIEHIVVDGNSSDGSVELIRARGNRISRLISESDDGVYQALNKGIAAASGAVVGFLHSDDVFAHSDVLAEIAKKFQDPDIQGVYGDLEYVSRDQTSRVIRSWVAGRPGNRSIWAGWMPPHPTLFLRKSIYDVVGVFDLRYQIASDYHFMLRLFSRAEFKCAYLPRVITRMRVGGVSNRSINNVLRKSREDLAALRDTGLGGYSTLAMKNLRKLPQFLVRSKPNK